MYVYIIHLYNANMYHIFNFIKYAIQILSILVHFFALKSPIFQRVVILRLNLKKLSLPQELYSPSI